ncbi:CPBP family intramembrane glutamic endopeptidase [Actinophytocola sp.]|uniref:CPBP family intramembrane glutamic endopeptidase n=1 Tax=Actinophytocola sp. TaxID=1872138 RepID=UPI002D361980|nr:CPBP family intramembrane glutamic endopeptidase [Actinophytocola sp.]HYQ69861.1 CPBP family intramembrane glutamic endopeptidase [Actinophytocola sp.]
MTRPLRALFPRVPAAERETVAVRRRRRRVVAVTAVTGAGLLGVSLSTVPGSPRFYRLTTATATTWIAGSLLSGPLHLGRSVGHGDRLRRPVLVPALLGVAVFVPFYGCALVCRGIPPLNRMLTSVLAYAHRGSNGPVLATTLLNGAAEEVFFRGALYAAIAGPTAPITVSTATYVLATTATRNPMLVAASAVLGTVFAVQRHATGGIQASMITHLVWSTLMLRFLPPLFPPPPHPDGSP